MYERLIARQALLQQIVEALTADDRFVAAWLTGSLARQNGDELSDIDLSVVVAANYAPLLCDHPWTVAGRTTNERLKLFQQFGEPVIIHENNNNAPNGGTFTYVTYRAAALTVDWTLLPQENAIRPELALTLFNKGELTVQSHQAVPGQYERAQLASERVAFFWMMTTVTIKYMLRGDSVFFHTLLDGLHRIVNEVAELMEGRSSAYRGGSRVGLAVSQHEQRAAVQEIVAKMRHLIPQVIAAGGYASDEPAAIIDYLLQLTPTA